MDVDESAEFAARLFHRTDIDEIGLINRFIP